MDRTQKAEELCELLWANAERNCFGKGEAGMWYVMQVYTVRRSYVFIFIERKKR